MTDSLPHLHLLGVGVVFNEDIAWLEISVDDVLFSEHLRFMPLAGERERERERDVNSDRKKTYVWYDCVCIQCKMKCGLISHKSGSYNVLE